jgi:hypothetical protein
MSPAPYFDLQSPLVVIQSGKVTDVWQPILLKLVEVITPNQTLTLIYATKGGRVGFFTVRELFPLGEPDGAVQFNDGGELGGDATFVFAKNTNTLSVERLTLGDYLQGAEGTEPAAPLANGYRLFAEDDGSGNTQLKVRFETGPSQVLATMGGSGGSSGTSTVLTADPVAPADDTFWVVRTGTSPTQLISVKARINGTTVTLAEIEQ